MIHEDSIVLQSVFTEARKRLETQTEEKEESESVSKGISSNNIPNVSLYVRFVNVFTLALMHSDY